MAHEIDRTARPEGAAMFVGTPAWHGIGRVLTNAPTSSDAIREAGLDWEVVKRPVMTSIDEPSIDDNGDPVMVRREIAITDKCATVRKDTGSVLGIVGDGYSVLQNSEAFAFLDALVNGVKGVKGATDGNEPLPEVYYESAGSLKDGRVVWMLARLGTYDEIVPGDPVVPYMLLSNAHDGTRAVRAQATTTRVVCWNTLSAAWRERNRAFEVSHYSFRHVGELDQKLAQATAAIRATLKAHRQVVSVGRALAGVRLDPTSATGKERVSAYMAELYPEVNEKESKRSRDNARAVVGEIIDSFLHGKANNMPGVAGTAWGLFNAVTEYIDHRGKSRSQENRIINSWFGDDADFKAKALTVAAKMFAGAGA